MARAKISLFSVGRSSLDMEVETPNKIIITRTPSIYSERPRHVSIPENISIYRHKPLTTLKFLEKSSRRSECKKKPNQSTRRKSIISQWRKQNNTLIQLKKLSEIRKKNNARQQRENKLREVQLLKHSLLQNNGYNSDSSSKHAKGETPITKVKEKKANRFVEGLSVVTNPVKVTTKKKFKAISARPTYASKTVYVKKTPRYETRTARFVNCFYRVCCQFYCYLTCIIAVAFAIVFII